MAMIVQQVQVRSDSAGSEGSVTTGSSSQDKADEVRRVEL